MHKAVDLTKFTKEINKSLSISSGFNDPTDWVSTGNFLLNYLISGDWYKGIPLGKLTMFAGGSGSGKSLVCSGNLVRECQKHDIMPIVLDTENALDEEWLLRLGVDTSPDKLMRFPVVMINDVGKILHTFIEDYKEKYMDLEPEERPKFMFIIDSLGMLITDTDADQFRKGDMKGDMGRKPKQLNALVRNIMGKIADCNIGVVCTNHTYESQDMFDPDQKISGGCLINGTEVITEVGLKMIEDMEIGDRVLSNDGEFHDVLKTWEFEKPIYRLELEDGQVFECSPEHKFAVGTPEAWVWVEAQNLTDSDSILSFEDSELPE